MLTYNNFILLNTPVATQAPHACLYQSASVGCILQKTLVLVHRHVSQEHFFKQIF